VQVTAAQRSVPPHTPPVHTSLVVAASPSSQGVPLAAAGSLHRPVAWSQVPASWHWSLAVQVTAAQRSTPPHTPPVQTSLVVAGSPSSQTVPLAAFGSLHRPVAESQLPTAWHWSLAVQVTAAQRSKPTHAPPTHWSPVVTGSPSSQTVPLAAAGLLQRPVDEAQVPASWH
jgi:hypothetical protein